MKDFRYIPEETGLPPKEIRLVMSAAIRLNPYKGFYPAQRTVDMVSQFSRSFGSGLRGVAGAGAVRTGAELFQTIWFAIKAINAAVIFTGNITQLHQRGRGG